MVLVELRVVEHRFAAVQKDLDGVPVTMVAQASRRKKYSMKSVMKKPATVPNTPRATLPPMAAASFSTLSTPSRNHPWSWAALTVVFSRTHDAHPPITGSDDRRSSKSVQESSAWPRRT